MDERLESGDRVVIIGGGIIGLASAWWLDRRGVPCVVLDQSTPGDGASHGNAGQIVYGHPPLTRPGTSWRGLRWMFDDESPLLIRPRLSGDLARWLWTFHRHCTNRHFDRCMEVLAHLGWETARGFDLMLEDAAIECDWRPSGWLDVCLERSSLEQAATEIDHLARYGYHGAPIDGDALRAEDPAFTDEVAGAIRYEESASLDPWAFMIELRRVLSERGVDFREGDGAGVERIATSEGRLEGVVLSTGETIASRRVVIAAGTWTGPLAATVGLDVPMEPARGYHREILDLDPMPRLGGVLRETYIAVTPMFDRLRLAGTLELAGHGRPWSQRRIDHLTRAAGRYLKGIPAAHLGEAWAGYRPCTPDGMPMIGEIPWMPGVVVATGHAMMGMTLGPVTGRLVSETICDGRPSIESPLLSADRFGRVG